MRTYTEEEFKKEYERGLYNGKVEVVNDLISVINNGYNQRYDFAYKLVVSFAKMMENKLRK